MPSAIKASSRSLKVPLTSTPLDNENPRQFVRWSTGRANGEMPAMPEAHFLDLPKDDPFSVRSDTKRELVLANFTWVKSPYPQ